MNIEVLLRGIVFALALFGINLFFGKIFTKYDGTMHIDTSYEDADIYNLEIDTPLTELPKKKKLIFKVDPDAKLQKLSQEKHLP